MQIPVYFHFVGPPNRSETPTVLFRGRKERERERIPFTAPIVCPRFDRLATAQRREAPPPFSKNGFINVVHRASSSQVGLDSHVMVCLQVGLKTYFVFG